MPCHILWRQSNACKDVLNTRLWRPQWHIDFDILAGKKMPISWAYSKLSSFLSLQTHRLIPLDHFKSFINQTWHNDVTIDVTRWHVQPVLLKNIAQSWIKPLDCVDARRMTQVLVNCQINANEEDYQCPHKNQDSWSHSWCTFWKVHSGNQHISDKETAKQWQVMRVIQWHHDKNQCCLLY